MTKPSVSVVMAAYNAETTIEKSVRSILDQTLPDFELLICDDCSTDGTYALLLRLARQDERIRVFRNERNRGQAFARNRLFGLSEADYIAIMDADDFSERERLSKQREFLRAHPEFDYVSACPRWIDDEGVLSVKISGITGEVKKSDYLWGLPFLHPATMFTKKAISAAGGYRVEAATRYRNEDYDMLMRMCALGFRGYVLPERLYIYYEGAAALKRRKYRYRWAEARIRYVNFKRLGLMPRGMIYVLKPLIVGLFSQRVLGSARAVLYAKRTGRLPAARDE
ncbi:MAG TPA: glycosyltransferase family 2 protein [Feifaniaceae bacterium]|nr:glycosyltransferase family 2 protein [Feifaniaceae bacterium]